MTFDQFIAQWNGKGIDFDGYYGFQCMDLAHRYAIDCVGKDILVGNAKDQFKNIDGYEKITNSPTGVPTKGDIIVWGTGVGENGHIAVFIEGDASSFKSFDQNWPVGSLCHIQQHNYTGVLGWLHPKEVIQDTLVIQKWLFESLVTKATALDKFTEAGYIAPDQIKALLATSELAKNNAETHVVTLENALKGANMEIGQLQEKLGTIPTPENPIPKHTELSILGLRLWILNE